MQESDSVMLYSTAVIYSSELKIFISMYSSIVQGLIAFQRFPPNLFQMPMVYCKQLNLPLLGTSTNRNTLVTSHIMLLFLIIQDTTNFNNQSHYVQY